MATSKTLQIILQMQDDATKKLAGFGNVLDRNSEQIKNVGRGMTVAGAAIAGMAGVAINAASDLGESINAVNVVFGEASEGILALSANAAKSVGLSKTQFNSLAVQFSSFAEKIAGKGGDVTKVIDDITKRSADFASVMNIDVANAAHIFQSALAGETEPIKKYGIDLSMAAVEAYALANGMKKGKEELTEQQKVLARHGLLMQQTAKVQGDFVNTADGMANASRVVRAQLANVSTQIGEALVPAIGSALAAIKPYIEKMSEWIKANPELAGKIAIVVAAIGGLLLILGPLLIILPGLVTAIGLVGTALAFLAANPIVLIIAAIVAVVAAIVLLIKNWDEAKAFLLECWDSIKVGAQAIWTSIKNFFVSIWESIKAAAAAAWDAIKAIASNALRAILAVVTLGMSELAMAIANNWDAIKAKTSAAWDAIKGVVKDNMRLILAVSTGGVSEIAKVVSEHWARMLADAKAMWEKIKAAISAVIESIVAYFVALPSQALAWGENMMSSFIQGIRNKIGAAGQAAKDAANSVASFLGFNSPTKEGPGRNVDKWGGNMIQAIADGMLQKQNLLRSVASSMLTGIPGTLATVGGGTAGRAITSSAGGAGGSTRSSMGGNTFNFYGTNLNGTTRQQADQLWQMLQDKVNNSLKT